MRNRPILAALALCLCLLAMPQIAQARSAYCSASGDVCYGVLTSGGTIRLNLSLAAKYFSRYKLCVTVPNHRRTCHRFKVYLATNGGYASTVRWSKRFPNKGRGRYRVRWFAHGKALGPRVSFKR